MERRVIYKYRLAFRGHDTPILFELGCRPGEEYQILSCGWQEEGPVAWIEHPKPVEGAAQATITIVPRFTGRAYEAHPGDEYFGTLTDPGTGLVFHFFDRVKGDA